MNPRARVLAAALIAMGAVLGIAGGVWAQEPDNEPEPNTPIEHLIVLMQENHTFDNYFGTYPGADGHPADTCMPLDPDDTTSTDCVEPFHIGDREIEDLDHSSRTIAAQFNDGRMDGFIAALEERNQDGTFTMGYYDDRDLPYYWNIADEYVLFDRFFTSAAGGSVQNHMFWVTGVAGTTGEGIPDEGFDDIPTIFDRLEERGISWKFYVQNYDPTITYRTRGDGPRSAQVVWVPLLNYARYIDDPELFSHIVGLDEYFEDLRNGTLPAVSYIVPSGASEHPPGSLKAGQRSVRTLITELMRSDAWPTSAFMWTYDDSGGWFDHVVPPQVDEFGYGFRAPAFLVSPYARRGYIDSTELDFTSFLKFIEDNWDLEPLAVRDAQANSFVGAFDFSQPPREALFLPTNREIVQIPESKQLVVYGSYGFAAAVPAIVFSWAAGWFGFLRDRPFSSISRALRRVARRER